METKGANHDNSINKSIFLAFEGHGFQQFDAIQVIDSDFECWNLQSFTVDEFVNEIQKKIPPVNDNVLVNYKLDELNSDLLGITQDVYSRSVWGIHIPVCIKDATTSAYAETLFLMNLYSPEFLYPVFSVSDFGIMRPPVNFSHYGHLQNQNQSSIFKTSNFVSFFQMLLPQSQYGIWTSDRAQRWEKEDWRLFVASMLFIGLQDYDNGKNPLQWQRESTDMSSILEALFTANDKMRTEIQYRLKKRIAVLLSNVFPDVEKRISDLYGDRSDFVHGDFFAGIAKETSKSSSGLPMLSFERLHQQRRYVQWALVAYLYFAKVKEDKPEVYGEYDKIIDILEKSIIDIELRNNILNDVEAVFALMPNE